MASEWRFGAKKGCWRVTNSGAILVLAMICSLFLVQTTARAASFRTVVIDAGHGGHDRGGIPGQRVAEKVVALDVAKRLEILLKAEGMRTVMTRRSDVFVSLGQRVAIANAQRGAIFVSVHFNSAERVGANGIETYYYTGNSGGLASRIHNEMMRVVRSEDRGVRRRGFYVVRRTRIPSVLVECGFLTNPREAALAQQPKYRQMLAERIARGIVSFQSTSGRGSTSSVSQAAR